MAGVVLRDGRPLADVLVTFLPDSMDPSGGGRALGVTDSQGRFQLRGEDQQEGATPGGYMIVVEDLAIYSAPRSEDGTVLSLPRRRFPVIYGDPLRTTLRRTLGAGSQTVELDLAGGL